MAELGNKICNIALLIDVKAITLTMGSQKKTYKILDIVQKGGGVSGTAKLFIEKGMDM